MTSMATTQASAGPHLETTMPDDDMELSSDIDRRPGVEEDIDIDLELTEDHGQDQDDDYIIEDARSEAPTVDRQSNTGLTNDDIMLDEDGIMQEDINIQDEELYDVSDPMQDGDGYHAVDGTTHNPVQDTEEVIPGDVQDTNISPPGNFEAPTTLDEVTVEEIDGHAENLPHEEVLIAHGETSDIKADGEDQFKSIPESAVDNQISNNQHSERDIVSTEEASHPDTETVVEENHEDHASAEHYTPHEESPHAEETYSQSAVHLHPVVVIYQGSEMSLFPPSNQDSSDTFLLQEEALANGSLSGLFEACRSVLADSISDEEELEISIEELGLNLSEDSNHANSASLSHILEVYVRLQRQDGVAKPDPLYMTLSTKTRFSKRLSDLFAAATEGKGISQLPFWEDSGDEDYVGTNVGEIVKDGSVAPTDQKSKVESPRKDRDEDHPAEGDSENLSVSGIDEAHTQDLGGEDLGNERHSESPVASDQASEHNVPKNLVETRSNAGPETEPNTDGRIHEELVTSEKPSADEEEEDLIDYSDEEGDANKYASTGSSTLQGDESGAPSDSAVKSETDKHLGATESLHDEEEQDDVQPIVDAHSEIGSPVSGNNSISEPYESGVHEEHSDLDQYAEHGHDEEAQGEEYNLNEDISQKDNALDDQYLNEDGYSQAAEHERPSGNDNVPSNDDYQASGIDEVHSAGAFHVDPPAEVDEEDSAAEAHHAEDHTIDAQRPDIQYEALSGEPIGENLAFEQDPLHLDSVEADEVVIAEHADLQDEPKDTTESSSHREPEMEAREDIEKPSFDDADEINYDESDALAEDAGGLSSPTLLLASPTQGESNTMKRSRVEHDENDVEVDGSQDTKRVRSG